MNVLPMQHRLALGRVNVAVRRLASRYPFHVRVLEQFQVNCRPGLSTVGLANTGDPMELLIDPPFVLGISMCELCGVLVHEVNHVMFGHILQRPEEFPDRWALTVAQEVTANEFVREPLPGKPIVLAQFPQLPPGESTVIRYKRLCRKKRRKPVRSSDGTPRPSSATAGGDVPHLVDEHDLWQGKSEADDNANDDDARETVRQVLGSAYYGCPSGDVPAHVRESLAGAGIGTAAGRETTQLRHTHSATVNWRQRLRRYAGQVPAVHATFARPNRRLPQLVGIVPGTARRVDRPHIMAVVDTSSSITSELLEDIDAELRRLRRSFRVTLVECDVCIQAVAEFRGVQEVHGRGGTDLRPPFELTFLRKHRPDLLVYFTDGFGPAPERAPAVPVIWCLVPGGEPPVEWGRVIRCGSAEQIGNGN